MDVPSLSPVVIKATVQRLLARWNRQYFVALIIKSFRIILLSIYIIIHPILFFFSKKGFPSGYPVKSVLICNQPHFIAKQDSNVAGRTKYCDRTEEKVFYMSVSLGYGAPVVQVSNLDKLTIDLKINFSFCT